MAGNSQPTYTEALDLVHSDLATLIERSKNMNVRLDGIEKKLECLPDLDRRVTRNEVKLHIGTIVLGGVSLLGNAIAAALGMRQ